MLAHVIEWSSEQTCSSLVCEYAKLFLYQEVNLSDNFTIQSQPNYSYVLVFHLYLVILTRQGL